jgi:hypothetical protein
MPTWDDDDPEASYDAFFFHDLEMHLAERHGMLSSQALGFFTAQFASDYRASLLAEQPVNETRRAPGPVGYSVPTSSMDPFEMDPVDHVPNVFRHPPLRERYDQVSQRVREKWQSMLFDTATASKDHQTVTIKRADGSVETRSGVSQAWRNNNPGDIKGKLHLYGSIGVNGEFLIFSSEQDGFNGIIKNLKQSDYQVITVAAAIKKMAPSADHNDPVTYAKHVKSWTGIESDTKVSKLNETQLETVANAIKRQEGWRVGQVTTTKPTSSTSIFTAP